MMPNSWASSTGDRDGRHGEVGLLLHVEVEHLPDVHAVDVVGAEDEDVVRLLVGDDVEVLVDGVGGALEPLGAVAHLRRDELDVLVQEGREPPGPLDVGVERLRLVLHQHLHLEDAGVDEVGEDEVDDAVAAAEGDGGLGPVPRQGIEPAPLSPARIIASSLAMCTAPFPIDCTAGPRHRQGTDRRVARASRSGRFSRSGPGGSAPPARGAASSRGVGPRGASRWSGSGGSAPPARGAASSWGGGAPTSFPMVGVRGLRAPGPRSGFFLGGGAPTSLLGGEGAVRPLQHGSPLTP